MFEFIGFVVCVVVAIVMIILIAAKVRGSKGPGGAIKTLGNYARAGGESLKNIDPAANATGILSGLNDELDRSKRALQGYLANLKAKQRQVDTDKGEMSKLQGRLSLRVSNKDVAGATEVQMQINDLQETMNRHAATLKTTTDNYEVGIQKVKQAQVNYDRQKASITDLVEDVQLSKADKASDDLIGGLSLDDHNSELADAKRSMQTLIDTNRAGAEVNARLGIGASTTDEDAQVAQMNAKKQVEALMAGATAAPV